MGKDKKDTVLKISKDMEKRLNSQGKITDEREWGVAGFADDASDDDLVGDFDDHYGIKHPKAKVDPKAAPKVDRTAEASNLNKTNAKSYGNDMDVVEIRKVDENVKPASFKNVKDENESVTGLDPLKDTLELDLRNINGKAGGSNPIKGPRMNDSFNAMPSTKMISDFDDEAENATNSKPMPKSSTDKKQLDEWKEEAAMRKNKRDYGDGFN